MDVTTAHERGRERADDAALLVEALSEERVMLTNDTDFLKLAADLGSVQTEFAPIFFWPQQQRTVRQIVQRVVQLASQNDYTSLCSQVIFL